MIWFISDTHYGHKNIVRGISAWTDRSGCRNFDTLEAHDAHVVELINNTVARHDILWHLGDWSFGGKDRIKEFRDRVNCEKIHIVRGNHDHHIPVQRSLFESVQDYKELAVSKLSLVLSHYPIEAWHGMEDGIRHLHGHVHGKGRQMDGRLDVGIDAYGLISLDEVSRLPIATEQRHVTKNGGSKFAVSS